MYYLVKAVYKQTNEEVCKLGIMKKYDYEGLNLSDYELTVDDGDGNEVTKYNIEDLYGAYSDVNRYMIFLHVVDKKYFSLYKCLRYMDEQYTGYHSESDRPGRNIGCMLKRNREDYYFIYDSTYTTSKSKNTCTLDGIITNTDYWEIDGDRLIVHGLCYDVIYEITDTKAFNALASKLRVLGRNR